MDLKNKGSYTVVYVEEKGKYIITYNERGIVTTFDELEFDDYDIAKNYLEAHKQELDDKITNIKEEEQRRIEEELERKRQEEEERKRQEEEKRIKKEEKKKKREERKQKIKDFWSKGWVKFTSGFIAGVLVLTGALGLYKGITSAVKDDKEITSSDNGKDDDDLALDFSDDIDNIVEKDEELSTENFEKLVAEFSKPYLDKNINVTTEDLLKFVSIVNIDKLAEENPEFASNLFGTQTKEEYLSDAAKVIGMTYTYNRNVFEVEQSTENFIRISDAVYGPQKEVLQQVESYVDKIAEARYDSEKTNELITELLQKLGDPTSELSYLDNGVGFGMQVNIELIRSYLAKDIISKENLDMLTILTSSEEYVSNIFTVYDKCGNVNSKKLVK